ncbi:Hypothetical predicted protein [Marmota monax]|uniref:Uncharacterized protein n=1 Tax=Marmota monax TaxID=9995 RepID=A0A5E4AQL0_MARMO|nr:Hypothetical predicted protein [Marmota monax]
MSSERLYRNTDGGLREEDLFTEGPLTDGSLPYAVPFPTSKDPDETGSGSPERVKVEEVVEERPSPDRTRVETTWIRPSLLTVRTDILEGLTLCLYGGIQDLTLQVYSPLTPGLFP